MTEPPLDYQSPQNQPGNPLKVPAILLLVFGSLTLGSIALDLLSRMIGGSFTFTFGVHVGPPESTICFNAVSAVLVLVMMAGAAQMLRLQNFQFARAAAILAVIPCTASCCCIFTLPVGIWALVLLSKPAVKALFP